ncbi:hypothetical protein JAAARDRAFT_193129 [Jaapia argillacea MUCL 33604]|uniref:Uncharacterized protein n=1 Tax=Jaapia argillacea MUCL 33604 TaxID=933084 RepID=A0A067PUS7_9AGAM|nr:hypothetical protein JAAARDRAFT_193129 [Jaapia argillacea MUCL 33604]
MTIAPRKKDVLATCLSNLESIIFGEFHASFLNSMTDLSLPSLKEVNFDHLGYVPGRKENLVPFLTKHGGKLRTVLLCIDHDVPVFDLCPNITRFEYTDQDKIPNPSRFNCKVDHNALTKVIISCFNASDSPSNTRGWSQFFDALDLSRFPSLCEIQT